MIHSTDSSSFLPQDKVSDFAKMNPVTVLKETMRAAGDPRLSQWHEELVECGGEVKDIETVRSPYVYLSNDSRCPLRCGNATLSSAKWTHLSRRCASSRLDESSRKRCVWPRRRDH